MSNLKLLTIEDIANADDLQTKIVDVPAWGGSVEVRELTKQAQIECRQIATDEEGVLDVDKLELSLLCFAITKPALTKDHIEILKTKNSHVVDEILEHVYSLNSMDKEAIANTRAEFREEPGFVDGAEDSGNVGDVAAADEA